MQEIYVVEFQEKNSTAWKVIDDAIFFTGESAVRSAADQQNAANRYNPGVTFRVARYVRAADVKA